MLEYRLNYFNLRARGEVPRMILAYGEKQYVDRRIEFQGEEWPKVKPTTPFQQLPYLEVDGKAYCQSNAIARYLAKQYGLYGKTDLEQLTIDMVMDCMEDFIKPLASFVFLEDETKKAELKKKYEKEQIPQHLTLLEKMLSENGNGQYFAGDKLSVADIQVTHFLTFPDMAKINIQLHKYLKLRQLKTRVENVPQIKEWIAKRPNSLF